MTERKSVLQAFGGVRGLILIVAGFTAVVGFETWRRVSSNDAMGVVARDLGLTVTREGRRSKLHGRLDGLGVAVETTTDRTAGEVRYFTQLSLYVPDAPPGRIVGASLRQRAIGAMTGAERLATGDHAFDAEVIVSGPPGPMLAHLDADARAAIVTATAAGWSLEDFTWRAREPGRVTSAEKIRSLLDLGLVAARASLLDGDVATALRDLAARDPVPGVRAAAAAAIGGRTAPTAAPATPLDADEALAALGDVGSERAFAAALFLAHRGDDRQEVRMALVGALPDSQRQARAIAALAEVGGRIEALVLRAVQGEHREAAEAAAAVIEERLQ